MEEAISCTGNNFLMMIFYILIHKLIKMTGTCVTYDYLHHNENIIFGVKCL